MRLASMMPDHLLAALHLGDSAFPSGAFAFSWGLEGLAADGLVAAEADLAAVVEEVLVNRWRSFDRVVLRRVYAMGGVGRSIDDLVALDLEVETATWAAPLRAGSRRAGRALLNVHEKLGSAEARSYRLRIAADQRLGHLAVAQGIAWRGAGLPLEAAEAVGAWTAISSITSAAIRLGLVGHLSAQAVLRHARAVAAGILAETPDRDAPLSAFTPLLDIAQMRHQERDVRLFAN
jgi:urease accessory protein